MTGAFIGRVVLAALALAIAPATIANAGPPFVTDDPEPVDYGHLEIDLSSQGAFNSGTGNNPALGMEINYGALPGVQVSLSIPVGFSAPNRIGMAVDIPSGEFGVKYRFVHEGCDGWLPEIAIYPSIQASFGDDKIAGVGDTQEFLPVWIEKSFDDWIAYGGGGYRINPGLEGRDSWFAGWAMLRRLDDHLQLGAELFHESAQTRGAGSASGFNIGTILDLTSALQLSGSAGSGISGDGAGKRITYYIAFSWTD